MAYEPKAEKALEKAVIDFIRLHGGYAQGILAGKFRLNQGTAYERWAHGAEKGTPDVLACLKGRLVGVEVKKDEKTAEKWYKSKAANVLTQKHQASLIREAGGITLTVGSLGQLQDDLQELKLI